MKKDLFYSVNGLGEGTWALRNEEGLIEATDITTPPEKIKTEVYRILRDTSLTRDLKDYIITHVKSVVKDLNYLQINITLKLIILSH